MDHRIVHFEIPADDMDGLAEFYTGVFDWRIEGPPGMPDYRMITTGADGEGINGGLMKKKVPQQTGINYAMVESVSEYEQKVKQAGGQVIVPKTAIPRMGYFAVCLDPEHNPIGLFEVDPGAA